MKTNDIKKNMRVQLRNGWYGTMDDNARGNIRQVEVEGFVTEIGSVYAHDIMRAADLQGNWVEVEHTQAQNNLRKMVSAAGL